MQNLTPLDKHEAWAAQSSSILQETSRSGMLAVVVAAKAVVDSIAEVATVDISVVVEAASAMAVLSVATAVAVEMISSVVSAEVVGRHGPALTPATMNVKAPTKTLEESIAIDLNECGMEMGVQE
jgi:hypothetical protein